MDQKNIRLNPFGGRALAGLDITCAYGRQPRQLQVDFRLQGDLEVVQIPPRAGHPSRRDRLWVRTCFEFFMAAGESRVYWEFNISPSGHWNVYCFDDYRQGMRQEKAIMELPVDIRREPDRFCLGCMIDLDGFGLSRQTLVMGFAAVLRLSDGRNTYWAAVHPSAKPDFHRRESFIFNIPAPD